MFFQKKSLIASNYRKSLILNFKIQNQIPMTIQLSKSGKFSSYGGFEGDFIFKKNYNFIYINQ